MTNRVVLIVVCVTAIAANAGAQTPTVDGSFLLAKFAKINETYDGLYLTKPVREAVAHMMAQRFEQIGRESGFSPAATKAIAEGIRYQNLSMRPVATGFSIFETKIGPVEVKTASQVHALSTTLDLTSYDFLLRKYAKVRLEVQPVPPRDYVVLINGDNCEPTKESIYLVPPGRTTVDVTRSKKPPCDWSGDIQGGQEQTIKCKL